MIVSRLNSGLLLLAVLFVVAFVYWPGTAGDYVFDDIPNIVENPALEMEELSAGELRRGAFSSDAGRLHRPLAMSTFALGRYFFGLDPYPAKIINLMIHLINTVLVFSLILLLTLRLDVKLKEHGDDGLALIASPQSFALFIAAAWSLAPINLTGVLYLVQRMEAMASLFMLSGLIAYIVGRARIECGRIRSGWVFVLGGLSVGTSLAVLSKESGIMLPLFALLLEWLLFGFGRAGSVTRRALFWLFGLVLLVPGLAGLLTVLPFDPELPNRPFDLWERLWTQVHAMWFYIANIVAPSPAALSLYHDAFPVARGWNNPWSSLPALFGLLVMIVAGFFAYKKFPLFTFGILFFFIPHLLVSTVIPLEMVYEHRNYMASGGLFVAAFSVLLSKRLANSLFVARRAAIIGLVLLYGFLTFLRANEWSDPTRLAYFEATRQYDSPRANFSLALMLLRAGARPGEPTYSHAIEQMKHAANLPHASMIPHSGLIFEHARQPQLEVDPSWWDAIALYIENNSLQSQDVTALVSLNRAHREGRIQLDPMQLGHVLALAYKHHPNRSNVRSAYAGFLIDVAGDQETGYRLLLEDARLNPGNALAWLRLGRFQPAMGLVSEARASLERAKEMDPYGRYRDERLALQEKLLDTFGERASGRVAP